MGLPAMKQTLLTSEEYLKISASAEERYEFESGELVAMWRSSGVHSELVINAASEVKRTVKGRGCKVYAESVSLSVSENTYYLPDVMLTCDERDHADRNMKRYPGLVIEVLSPESVKRDRDKKFLAYLKIPSLQYYLLIAQDQIRIEVFSNTPGQTGWVFHVYESLEDVIPLDQLNIELSVKAVYDDVELSEPVEDDTEEAN